MPKNPRGAFAAQRLAPGVQGCPLLCLWFVSAQAEMNIPTQALRKSNLFDRL